MNKKKIAIVFALISLLSTVLYHFPSGQADRSGNDSIKPDIQNNSGQSESKIPVSNHPPQWWKTNTSAPIRLLKEDICQKAQVTFGNQLSPVFQVCLNEDGFRGSNFDTRKPADTFRIAALGDAVTFGLGVDNNQTLPAYLEKNLNDRYGGEYQVLNFGIPFMTTKEEVIWFNRTGRKYDPDLVVLQYMENDAENLTRIENLKEGFMDDLRDNMSQSRKSSIASRKAIRQERRERHNMSIEEEMETVDSYLTQLNQFSKQDDFDVFVMYYATAFSRRHVSYMREAAENRGWGFTVSDLKNDSLTYNESFYLTPEGSNRTAYDVMKSLNRQQFLEGDTSHGR